MREAVERRGRRGRRDNVDEVEACNAVVKWGTVDTPPGLILYLGWPFSLGH